MENLFKRGYDEKCDRNIGGSDGVMWGDNKQWFQWLRTVGKKTRCSMVNRPLMLEKGGKRNTASNVAFLLIQ